MDSAAGHRMAPELTAVAEKLEIGRAELPAWALARAPFEPAWQPDEAQAEGVPPARADSRAPLWWREEPAWAVQARLPMLERPGWKASRPPSGERPAGAEIPRVLLRRALRAEE